MSFDAAFARTVGIEGGYSNIPGDPGGETMWGITAAVARAHGYSGPMKDMPVETAKAIYRLSYWDANHLDDVDTLVSPALSAKMFDIGVNCGVQTPITFLQRALNAFNHQGKDYPDLAVDGKPGAVTSSALRNFMRVRGARGIPVMLAALNSQLGVHYLEIAERRPVAEDVVFGWFNQRVAV